uniref:Uncharacterized protein n=1 Tax=Utricularia reniformis TaxID=192314 RepID=A0A1Y0B096_9LAMI|nr:hypothetical protein AEK19_MT0535 [Utricularia reniformis]ART30791.1 hypothetical protein AEK19_MT0535 [Utricularia reniformis]
MNPSLMSYADLRPSSPFFFAAVCFLFLKSHQIQFIFLLPSVLEHRKYALRPLSTS